MMRPDATGGPPRALHWRGAPFCHPGPQTRCDAPLSVSQGVLCPIHDFMDAALCRVIYLGIMAHSVHSFLN